MNQTISRLGHFLFRSKLKGERPYTVLLGAGASISSGCPDWATLCKNICVELGIELASNDDPIHVLKERLFSDYAGSRERYLALEPYIGHHRPSLGYRHLAQLIASGYFATVLTTNWDTLLEQALWGLLAPEDYKVLVRGEVTDSTIVDYLNSGVPRVKIVKLHGDLVTRILMIQDEETFSLSPSLTKSLTELFERETIIVGYSLQDVDVLRPLVAREKKSSIYFVSPELPEDGLASTVLSKGRGGIKITGVDGTFDRFFADLNVVIQTKATGANLEKRLRTESAILEKQERGRGYINYNTISELVEQFSKKILAKKPSILFFINDPTAPGGMELKKRMERHIGSVPLEAIEISGEGKNRVYLRKVRSKAREAPSEEYQYIFILDSITFSGNTMRIACDEVKKWFPNAVVHAGVLIISQQLVDRLDSNHPLADIVYQAVTDRHEIFFPWGVTQTTGDFDRLFTGIEEERAVQIRKRPWGTIEILADEEVCSVRLLTIEADEKLSFQRHLCRDELFVALDDNIGLDVCADDLSEPFNQFDPKIKSLILETGDYILIPRGVWHRTKATKNRVRLLEVAFGIYDQVNDIQRLHDTFGRVGEDGSA